jgi:hypothetical protein
MARNFAKYTPLHTLANAIRAMNRETGLRHNDGSLYKIGKLIALRYILLRSKNYVIG